MKIRCNKSGFQRIKRLISIFIAYTLVFPHMTWAFETPILPGDARPVCINGLPIQIPAKLGKIVKSFQGNEELVIHIQDLHCNYEVQHNIAGIINLLAGNHGVKLVGIEGAGLPINVTKLSTFPMEKVKREVGDYYVKLGRISGPEFYAATGRFPVYLEGVETAEHYEANRECVNEFLNNESQGYVYDLRDMLKGIKHEICDPRLLKFDARELDELLRRLDIIEKLLSISASPEEIAEYRTYPERFRIGSFVKFICRYEIPDMSDLVREAYALEHYLAMAGDFYQMADQRSLDFVENLVKRMRGHDTEQAILVTGGYHSEVILKQLRQRRIGYVSVKPRLTRIDSVNPYFSLLKNRRTPLEKLLAHDKQVMALSPFFMPFEDTEAILTGNESFMPEHIQLDYRILGTVLKMIGFKKLAEDAFLFPLEKESLFAVVCSEAMRKKSEKRPLWVLPLNDGDELVFYRKKVMGKVAKALKAVGIKGGKIKKNYIKKMSEYPANIRENELALDAILRNPDGQPKRVPAVVQRVTRLFNRAAAGIQAGIARKMATTLEPAFQSGRLNEKWDMKLLSLFSIGPLLSIGAPILAVPNLLLGNILYFGVAGIGIGIGVSIITLRWCQQIINRRLEKLLTSENMDEVIMGLYAFRALFSIIPAQPRTINIKHICRLLSHRYYTVRAEARGALNKLKDKLSSSERTSVEESLTANAYLGYVDIVTRTRQLALIHRFMKTEPDILARLKAGTVVHNIGAFDHNLKDTAELTAMVKTLNPDNEVVVSDNLIPEFMMKWSVTPIFASYNKKGEMLGCFYPNGIAVQYFMMLGGMARYFQDYLKTGKLKETFEVIKEPYHKYAREHGFKVRKASFGQGVSGEITLCIDILHKYRGKETEKIVQIGSDIKPGGYLLAGDTGENLPALVTLYQKAANGALRPLRTIFLAKDNKYELSTEQFSIAQAENLRRELVARMQKERGLFKLTTSQLIMTLVDNLPEQYGISSRDLKAAKLDTLEPVNLEPAIPRVQSGGAGLPALSEIVKLGAAKLNIIACRVISWKYSPLLSAVLFLLGSAVIISGGQTGGLLTLSLVATGIFVVFMKWALHIINCRIEKFLTSPDRDQVFLGLHTFWAQFSMMPVQQRAGHIKLMCDLLNHELYTVRARARFALNNISNKLSARERAAVDESLAGQAYQGFINMFTQPHRLVQMRRFLKSDPDLLVRLKAGAVVHDIGIGGPYPVTTAELAAMLKSLNPLNKTIASDILVPAYMLKWSGDQSFAYFNEKGEMIGCFDSVGMAHKYDHRIGKMARVFDDYMKTGRLPAEYKVIKDHYQKYAAENGFEVRKTSFGQGIQADITMCFNVLYMYKGQEAEKINQMGGNLNPGGYVMAGVVGHGRPVIFTLYHKEADGQVKPLRTIFLIEDVKYELPADQFSVSQAEKFRWDLRDIFQEERNLVKLPPHRIRKILVENLPRQYGMSLQDLKAYHLDTSKPIDVEPSILHGQDKNMKFPWLGALVLPAVIAFDSNLAAWPVGFAAVVLAGLAVAAAVMKGLRQKVIEQGLKKKKHRRIYRNVYQAA